MECIKCGHSAKENIKKGGYYFCSVCSIFVPDEKDKKSFHNYVKEKISEEALIPFRRYSSKKEDLKSESMVRKASQGNIMSRAPFGYQIQEGSLLPGKEHEKVGKIFLEFLKDYPEKITLGGLAKKYGLSINGLKKVLKNFTYIGKIKFNNQIFQGSHKPLISTMLFNQVQDKLESTGIK